MKRWLTAFSARTSFVVLLGLTTVALTALIAIGWRSLNAFETTITRVMQQVSVYTAEQTAAQIHRDLRSPVFDLLEQVDHAAIRSFDVSKIAETLKAAGSENFRLIDTFFVWSAAPGKEPELATASAERRVLFYSPHRQVSRDQTSAPGNAGKLGFSSNVRLAAVLLKEAAQWASVQRPFAVSYFTFDGRSYQVVYHYLLDTNNRLVLGGVEGFLADAEHLRQHYFPELLSGGAANAARDPAFPALAVSIFDEGGQEISRSGRSLLDKYDAQTSFPFLFFEPGLFDSLSPYHPQVHEWTVRTGFQSGDIQAIARQQTAPQRWAWLLASLVTAVGIGLTAISAVRQIRLSAMKSDFVASVSHDLRTPLTKIQLYADSLASARSKSQEKFDAYCRVISLQAKRLTQLIQELLDFSRIEAGVREYEMNELDLRDVLQDTLDMFDQEIGQDDRTTEIVLPDVPVPVLGSAEGLQQLFGNLISNALKYSPGEQYLRVALATGNGHATVKVTDRGIGVPRREHRQIFKKFYRSASAASTATGSGIGLAIVDHVARAHGGTVTVASDSGCGTTFTVTLPVVAESREVWW